MSHQSYPIPEPADDPEDPWAWLRNATEPAEVQPAEVPVTVFIEPDSPTSDEARLAATRQAVDRQTAWADEIVEGSAPPTCPADWLWLVPEGAIPAPDALAGLLTALGRQPELDVIGPVLVAASAPDAAPAVVGFGLTANRFGKIRSLSEPGELLQGQLEPAYSLGVDPAGMLVRGEVWRELGGLVRDLPASVAGLEFGRRAVLAGHLVAVEPAACVVDERRAPDPVARRSGEMTLALTHSRPAVRWLHWLGALCGGLLTAVFLLFAKAPRRALTELRAIGALLRAGALRSRLRNRLAEVATTDRGRDRAAGFRPTVGEGVRRVGDRIADRLADWAAGFTGRGESSGIDELTGDDFAVTGRNLPRWSVLGTGLVLTCVLALIAARSLIGSGWLHGSLLAAPPDSWLALLQDYLAPIAGDPTLAAPVWTGFVALVSLVFLGNPGWLVTFLLIAAVPLTWVLAFRYLRQVVASVSLAALVAFGFALTPVLTGALGAGAVGAVVWSLLLPGAAWSVYSWQKTSQNPNGTAESWRAAAATAVVAIVAVMIVPVVWLAVVLGCVVLWRRGVRLAQVLLLGISPALVVLGPWAVTLWHFPGRLLTGIEPSLASRELVPAWQSALGVTALAGPPLWLVISVVATIWLGGFAGSVRSRSAAKWLVAGVLCAVMVLLLTRLLVVVPPGEQVRPLGVEWTIAMLGCVLLALAHGLDGLTADLRGVSLGLRHAADLALVGLLAGALFLAGGWWLIGGQTGVTRGQLSQFPAFVQNLQISATPGRTLAIDATTDPVTWTLSQDSSLRWGEIERGASWSGSAGARTLAQSVVARLIGGTADDQLLGDLVRLGVSAVWLNGGSADQRTAIGNTPGLGLGTGDTATMVWLVPDSARMVVITDSVRTITGRGQQISAGELWLAEPADPRWRATVDGVELDSIERDLGQGFVVSQPGVLNVELESSPPWWAWLQAVGLLLLLICAGPVARVETDPASGRIAEPAAGGQV